MTSQEDGGFRQWLPGTLIEWLIIVAIVGIIASILFNKGGR